MQLTKHWAKQLEDYVIDLAWSPDGLQLAAAAASGPVSLFKALDGAIRELPGHEDGTNCLGISPSGVLATAGQDGTVKFWDTDAGQHISTSDLKGAWIEHLAWQPAKVNSSSDLAVTAGRELIFLKPDGSIKHRFPQAPKTLSSVVWHPEGGAIAAACFGQVSIWDADDFIEQKQFPYANGIHALTWSPDGRWLVSGNQDPSVHLWLPEEDQEFHMSGYETKVKELSFDRTGQWLATGGGQDVCVWDCTGAGPEGREPIMLPHEARICAVSFQNKYRMLASASEDGSVSLWSPDRPNPLRANLKMPSPATKLAWSPDDSMLAIGSRQGVVYVLKVQN